MGVVDKERSVKDVLHALEGCATGATAHQLAQARHILLNSFNLYEEAPLDPELQLMLDEAIRNALRELAVAVWSRRRSCG